MLPCLRLKEASRSVIRTVKTTMEPNLKARDFEPKIIKLSDVLEAEYIGD
jgi:hypothetical protein